MIFTRKKVKKVYSSPYTYRRRWIDLSLYKILMLIFLIITSSSPIVVAFTVQRRNFQAIFLKLYGEYFFRFICEQQINYNKLLIYSSTKYRTFCYVFSLMFVF